MKQVYIWSFVIIAMIFSITVYAENITKPKLSVSIETIDLGKIKPSQTKEYILTIQNTGGADLVIASTNTDCPCTSFQFLSKEGRVLPDLPLSISPGTGIQLKLHFDSNRTKFVGAFKKHVLIGSNDLEEPMKRIWLVGEIGE